ncbi:TetR/AcrR family transcriptional regulator C-terminal domain-containing protein [Amycolatopsis sp. CA-126428]|uniref:TetR/AcrR family transcriptional regulator C-terminal domain-containing protein n=1 Tax=Amycolatopsis sp. CA-126428 TaxID=2073158 RepID=UPI001E362E80|nr:hypothetical protein [Amycolatopsis sp. CA-126428]
MLFEHPPMARAALVGRPSGENYLRLVERILDLLVCSGAGREQVARGANKLLQDAPATAAERATRAHDPAAGKDWDATVRVLDAVDVSTHPAIAVHVPALIGGSVPDRIRWSFDVLINGITHTPVLGAAD